MVASRSSFALTIATFEFSANMDLFRKNIFEFVGKLKAIESAQTQT